MEIQLLKLFTEIMTIANARSGYHVSEKVIEILLNRDQKTLVAENAGLPLNNILEKSAILTLPVGEAAQDAAISAIFILGKRHAILRDVATQALRSLCKFKGPIAEPYLKTLEAS